MNHLQEIIDTTNKLSQRLENMANDERNFCTDIQLRFEQMAWEMFKTANELKAIREYI